MSDEDTRDPQISTTETEDLHLSGCCSVVGIGHSLLYPTKVDSNFGQVSQFTGTLLEIGDQWFMATAAHCLKAEREHLRNVDSAGVYICCGNEDVGFPIPNFLSDRSSIVVERLDRERGEDFAVMQLSDEAVVRLRTYKKLPIVRETCVPDSSAIHNAWGITGYPKSSRQEISQKQIRIRPATVRGILVSPEMIESDPTGPNIDEETRFILQLDDAVVDELSLTGMSGGLMHAIQYSVEGDRLRPQRLPIAIQAKWWMRRFAAGTPLLKVFYETEKKLGGG